MTRKLRINWPAVVLAVGFVAFVGYQSAAMRHLMNLQPPVIATVDLHQIMTRTAERAKHDAAVQAIVDDLHKRGDELRKELDEVEKEVAMHAVGGDLHQKALEELTRKSLEYRGFQEWARRKIEAESASRLRRLYTAARRVIAEEARASGYDIVVVNDALGEIRAGDEAEVMMQITARRMLYSSTHLDITADVIARMDATVAARGE